MKSGLLLGAIAPFCDLVKEMEGVLPDSVLEFEGKMVLSEYVKQGGKEFLPTKINILSKAEALPLEDNANIDTRLDYRWLDLRSKKNNIMMPVGICSLALIL